MNNFICRKATKKELIERWEYLVNSHPCNEDWKKYRETNLYNFDNKYIVPYYGFLNGKIICEMTVYIKEEAFIGDVEDPSNLLSNKMAYLAGFRTNKEYEGKGFFGKLFKYVINDLKNNGYDSACLGVNPMRVRNIEIYFHLGFREYIKTLEEISYDENSNKIKKYTNYYKMYFD